MTATTGVVAWLVRRLTSRRAALVVVLALMVNFFVDGELGIDFGSHWDEGYHTEMVADCVQRLSLLPTGLSYGGPYFTLGFPVVLVDEWGHLKDLLRDVKLQPGRADPATFPSIVNFKASALNLIRSGRYVLQVRTVFLAVSSLAALWMFLAVRRAWPRRTGGALAAAAFMALSWELGYHARWIAIDAPLAQFASLELFLFIGAWRAGDRQRALHWYLATAAGAGAVFSCKLTGVFGFLPVLLTALLRPGYWRLRQRVGLMFFGGLVFLVTAFVLSPQFFINPLQVLYVFRGGSADYNNIPPNYAYYVGLTEHVGRVLVWFAGAVPSPFPMLALSFTAVGLIGLGSLLRRETRMTIAWVSFPAAFIYAFSRNHMLIVRQYLMCFPFLALCFARGTMVCWDFLRARDRRLGVAFAVAIVSGFAVNAVFEARQGWRVTNDSEALTTREVVADLRSNREGVRMTQGVLDRLKPHISDLYSCHAADKKDQRVRHVIAGWGEYLWMANRLFGFRHVYGDADVNMNYYVSWFGRAVGFRLMDVSVEVANAVELAIPATRLYDCFPGVSGAKVAAGSAALPPTAPVVPAPSIPPAPPAAAAAPPSTVPPSPALPAVLPRGALPVIPPGAPPPLPSRRP